MKKYSILIPVHNESDYIPILLEELEIYHLEGNEIIIIDDGSTDRTNKILKKYTFIKLIEIKKNSGKGYALRQGLKRASNDKIIIFDGDMEIKPSEISKLMILDSKSRINCVLGCRFKSLSPAKSNFDWGNFMFTSFFNIVFNSQNKDVLCCAKAFYLRDIKNYQLSSIGFDIDIELSALLSILGSKSKISNIILQYNRRTFKEGKKLKVSDGWIILLRIIKMAKYL
tara:strand:- start:2662 stop:3342 length:681 start_codon:yes stop_codon:yes gene_type:complete